MLQKKGTNLIKIVDFGIAGVKVHFNIENVKIGSLKYMAPEILSGKINKITPNIDIWALGVILYILVTGEYPFNGETNEII